RIPSPTSRATPRKRAVTRGSAMVIVCTPQMGIGWTLPCDAPHASGSVSSAEFGEPDADLARGGLLGVRAVHEVLDDRQVVLAGEIAADRAGGGLGRIGGAGQGAE